MRAMAWLAFVMSMLMALVYIADNQWPPGLMSFSAMTAWLVVLMLDAQVRRR